MQIFHPFFSVLSSCEAGPAAPTGMDLLTHSQGNHSRAASHHAASGGRADLSMSILKGSHAADAGASDTRVVPIVSSMSVEDLHFELRGDDGRSGSMTMMGIDGEACGDSFGCSGAFGGHGESETGSKEAGKTLRGWL